MITTKSACFNSDYNPGFHSLDNAIKLHEAGKIDEAEAAYRQILQAQPSNPDALQLLGLIACQRKNYAEAAKLILQAISFNKRAAEYRNNLGNVYLAQDMLELAEKCYRKALQLQPQYADALANLGAVFWKQGKLQEAESVYRKALELDAGRAETHQNFGTILAAIGKPDEALEHQKEAIRLKPDSPDALSDLADTYKMQRKFREAIATGLKALEIDPRNARTLTILGEAYTELHQPENGVVFYRQALNVDPNLVETYLKMADALRQQGKIAESRNLLRTAMRIAPASLLAQLRDCISQIPLLHRSTREIIQTRENYRKALETLCRSVDLTDPEVRKRARSIVGSLQPFFLAYQGENDRELQAIYGDLMTRVQAACFPQWAHHPPMPPIKPGEPIRVGILSGFYHHHSNWKMPIKGWVEHLNRKEFELYGYYTGWTHDKHTESARKNFHRFTENITTQEEWCRIIAGDRLHILIIPEIGMDPLTPRLAAFRLAPIQCTSWGHPDTTGFPTIDYYLSSDLMEPENGQDHYCEKLVRLPNLSIYYEPLDIQAAPVDRAHFGLRDDLPLFICTQSLFKYLPQYDEVFPRIARETGPCQFAFIGYPKSTTLGERFLQRLETAFSRFGLRSDDYVKMLPSLDPSHYRALNQLADVFLDSIGWSGCNSSMEALICNLPIVTMPGELMRGRHTHAILKMMGIDDMEGRNMDEYVAIAARMIKHPEWRREISEKIAHTKHRAYRDTECICGLENFIRQVVTAETGDSKD